MEVLLLSFCVLLVLAPWVAGVHSQPCTEWKTNGQSRLEIPEKDSYCKRTVSPHIHNPDSCSFTIIDRDIPECKNMSFSGMLEYDSDLVKINPYWNNLGAYFNISFAESTWKYMKYRLHFRRKSNNAPLMFCAEVYLPEGAPNTAFASSCSLPMGEGSTVDLFFSSGASPQAMAEVGHYRMRVPFHNEVNPYIKNPMWSVIAVLDMTKAPDYRVHWKMPPEHVRAGAFCARVFDGGEKIWEKKVNAALCGEYCTVSAYLTNASSNLITLAPIMLEGDICREDLEETLPVVLAVTGSLLLIAMLTVLVLLALLYYLISSRSSKQASMVFVHLPAFRVHHEACEKLVHYLEEVAGVKCISYERACLENDYLEPSSWLESALQEAQTVLVVANPPSTGAFEMQPHERPAFALLDALENILHNSSTNDVRKKLVAVVPFYLGGEAYLPPAVKGTSSYEIPTDTTLLVARLHHYSPASIAVLRVGRSMLRCWPLMHATRRTATAAAERVAFRRGEKEGKGGEEGEEGATKKNGSCRIEDLEKAWEGAGHVWYALLKAEKDIEDGETDYVASRLPLISRFFSSQSSSIPQVQRPSYPTVLISDLSLGGSRAGDFALRSTEGSNPEVSIPAFGQVHLSDLDLGGSTA